MQDIADAFNANTQKLIAWTDSLRPEQFATRPQPDKWSVLEVLEHLFVSEKGSARLSALDCEPAERDLARTKAMMERGLADLDQKFAGGSNIDPKARFADYPEWRAAFLANRETLLRQANEKGYDGLCTSFAHPYFGHLTRAEWLIFSGLHADRHLDQMRRYVQ